MSSVAVKLVYSHQSVVHEIPTDVPVDESMTEVLAAVGVTEKMSNFMLRTEDSQSLMGNDGFAVLQTVENGDTLTLCVKPDVLAMKYYTEIENPTQRKMAAHNLANAVVEDRAMAQKYLELGGLEQLSGLLSLPEKELPAAAATGLMDPYTTLYALSGKWESVPGAVVARAIVESERKNLKTQRLSMQLLATVIEGPEALKVSPTPPEGLPPAKEGIPSLPPVVEGIIPEVKYLHGWTVVWEALGKGAVLKNVTNVFKSQDTLTKNAALRCVNALIRHAPGDEVRAEVLAAVDSCDFNKLVKDGTRQTDQALSREMYYFLAQRMIALQVERKVAFDGSNPEHCSKLMSLWETAFPDVELTDTVSKQWGDLGFQGKDPATDFRAMGVYGLNHLTFFAETQSEIFAKIARFQAQRADGHDYPFCVAGINISCMILNILTPSKEEFSHVMAGGSIPNNGMAIILSKENVIEELFVNAAQVFNHTWDAMQATYMMFSGVMKYLAEQVRDVLVRNPQRVESFRKNLDTICNRAGENRDQITTMQASLSEESREIRKKLRENAASLVRERILASVDGVKSFPVAGSKQKVVNVAIGTAQGVLMHGEPGDVKKIGTATQHSLDLTSCGIFTGMDSPVWADKKKTGEPAQQALTISVVPASEPTGGVHFVAPDSLTFDNILATLSVLQGKEPSQQSAQKAIESLTTAMMVPYHLEDSKKAPEIPELPANMEFST